MFDWNDLKYLLAVSRHGSTLAAARALEVNQSTVQRRLAELERRIGRPLVERHTTGYRLTEFGRTLLPQAERVEAQVQSLQQQVEHARRAAAGVLRVTCPEPLMLRLTGSPLLGRFAERFPQLKIEFVMSDKYLDMKKGEVDVALRSGDTDDGELVGRVIGDSLWALYASKRYVEQHGQPRSVQDLAGYALIGLDDSMAHHRAAVWLREVALSATVAVRNNSVLGMLHAAKSGLGIAPLPTAIADAEPQLQRLLGPIAELTRSWRILTRPELRRTPRVAAFFDFVVDEIETLRPIITG
jgi:DNA-binding transcriptional LysR family regulator